MPPNTYVYCLPNPYTGSNFRTRDGETSFGAVVG
jgi:hypothetical protein